MQHTNRKTHTHTPRGSGEREMSDIWRAVEWWDEWQLRILVLGSLGFQWFLLLAAPLRKYTIPRWFGKCIWLAYISCDALAIYALATLFNRHARATSSCDYGAKASSLEVLWAPILLIYLGGREEITAYNIEDNELWTRQTVTLVSQVTVALYAFYKSWPSSSDRKLLLSAILLFIVGILSFCEKPWALRRASINRLVAMSSLMKGERENPSKWDWCFAELSGKYKFWKKRPDGTAPILSQGDKVQMILSDLSLWAAEKTLEKRSQESGRKVLETLEPNKDALKDWVRQSFGLIYTRANVILTPAYLACHVLLVPSLYIATVLLFATSHKHGYNRTDVMTTYVLLCLTFVLDVFGVLISELVYWLMSSKTKVPALCENLPGYNLIDSALRLLKPTTGPLLRCAKSIGYKEGYFGKRRDDLYRNVSEFIIGDLLNALRGKPNPDLSTYRSLTAQNWILPWDIRSICFKNKQIKHILTEQPFDASVLIWHIATDLCTHSNNPRKYYYSRRRPPQTQAHHQPYAEAISNYMVHLLNFRPEMLMTGSRQHLFTEAMQHMERILKGELPHYSNELVVKIKNAADKLVKDPKYITYTLINDACMLAEELLKIEDVEKRWKLLYGVWVGMLCYSASMCRGYLHAKSLGEGGQFLSLVWLVISLKGAKTLADRLQMPPPPKKDDVLKRKFAEEEKQEDYDLEF
uniref:DUF4220 domain-containing protein n=1 Tax=Arundo donax TaxID=35708 RepID=A0A0A9FI70_ARUDO